MRTLVVYYSRSGTTRRVAEAVASRLGADVETITPKQNLRGPIGWLRAGRSGVKGLQMELEPRTKDASGYDLVVIGTPVWGGDVSGVVRSYLVQEAGGLARVAFLVTAGGTKTEKTLGSLQELCGKAPVATLCLRSRDVKKGAHTATVDAFVAKLRGGPA